MNSKPTVRRRATVRVTRKPADKDSMVLKLVPVKGIPAPKLPKVRLKKKR